MRYSNKQCTDAIDHMRTQGQDRAIPDRVNLTEALEERLAAPIIDRVFLDAIGKRMNVANVPMNGFTHTIAQAIVDEIWGTK